MPIVSAMKEQGLSIVDLSRGTGVDAGEIAKGITRGQWTAAGLLLVADYLGVDALNAFRLIARTAHLLQPLIYRG